VTLTYSRLARLHPQSAPALAAGIAAAWSVSLMRMATIAVVIAPALLLSVGMMLGPPAAVLALVALAFYWRAGTSSQASPLVLSDPFELMEVLKFGLLLAAVTLIAKLAGMGNHQMELLPLAAVSGLVDVDPITLSAARMSGGAISASYAATIILVAAGANLVFKCSIAVVLGSRRLAISLLAAAALAAGAAAAVWIAAG
jgi:uncharacterized membrane protein (DUF4010 family)